MARTVPALEETTIETFRDQLRGRVLEPDDDGYEEARTVWNAMIDKRPALIAQCEGPVDVVACVDLARDLDIELAVKGGGHNVAGKGLCEEGLVVDLSPIDHVRVDPDRETVRVGGGAMWGNVDKETQAFGLATTGGIVSTTGVGGLTLGGGLGYLARKHGLAHDNLRSIDVVTADGELVRASEDENPELFWGMRGGGGNFGIATSFEFDLHALGPEILNVRLVYAYEDIPEALRFYADFMANAPNEVGCYAAIVQGGPEFGMPEPMHGETLLAFRGLYAGDVEEARQAFEPLRDHGEPLADMTRPIPYVEHQQQADELYREGHRNYWKSSFHNGIPEGFIDALMEHVDPLPTPFTTVFFEWMEGAIAQANPDATAFPHRDKAFAFTVAPKWTDPDRDEELEAWAREFHQALQPYAAEGVYVNYLDQDESERVETAYGEPYQRLRELKESWDPDNLFSVNQNIEPST